MARINKKPRAPKKKDKKQQRKKQAALVERCIEALNSNVTRFREKISVAKEVAEKPPNGTLKHFQPIRIDTVERSVLTETAAALDKISVLSESNTKGETSRN
ncbi:unnamed protein product [Mesocestoides corti]|uniref:Uncharacterized protein n=1 Tax=Mesocestoides corti TaxID=53468 RepID=A0A0R3UMG8_MESCO|nr:unnamed protein product [Mesocestoides corti]